MSHSIQPVCGAHGSTRKVAQEHGSAETDAVSHRRGSLAGNQRLAAQDAVLVGEGQAHDSEFGRQDAALDFAHRGLALIGPQAGPLSEVHVDQATSGGRVAAAQLEPRRRRASNSVQ
jgi:hypothetical protein